MNIPRDEETSVKQKSGLKGIGLQNDTTIVFCTTEPYPSISDVYRTTKSVIAIMILFRTGADLLFSSSYHNKEKVEI